MDVKSMERDILELDAVPLLGGSPPFPLEQVAEDLGHRFQLDIRLDVGIPTWTETDEMGIGISVPGLDGNALFVMNTEETQAAMRLLLGGDRYGAALYDSPLRVAFSRFLVLELLHAAGSCGYPPDLTPRLADEAKIPGKVLMLELHAEAAGQTIGARLFVSQALVESWRRHFAPRKPHALNDELRQTLELCVGIEIGETDLGLEALRGLEGGDVLLIERVHEGVVLKLGEKQIVTGKREGRTIEVE